MHCNHASPVLPAIINTIPPIITPPGNSNTDICQVINTSHVQNVDDNTTEEDSENENMPCNPDKLPEGCYYKSCACGCSSR